MEAARYRLVCDAGGVPDKHLPFPVYQLAEYCSDVVSHPLAALVGRQGVRHVHDIGGRLPVVVGLQVVNIQVGKTSVLVLV